MLVTATRELWFYLRLPTVIIQEPVLSVVSTFGGVLKFSASFLTLRSHIINMIWRIKKEMIFLVGKFPYKV